MIKNRTAQNIDCTTCSVSPLCLPAGLNTIEVQELNTLLSNVRIVKKKNHIYYTNNVMQNLYAVHHGSCKQYWIDANGQECVTNFYFSGDLIGLESVADRKHLLSLVALEDTELCVIPIDPFFELIQKRPALLKRFINITSCRVKNDQISNTGITSNELVCDFLLNIIVRMQKRNHSQKNIPLPMSQLDISNYLGIAYETVNRIFQNLKAKKIIKMKNKTINVLDLTQLERLGRLDYSIMNHSH